MMDTMAMIPVEPVMMTATTTATATRPQATATATAMMIHQATATHMKFHHPHTVCFPYI